jgi:hypothetical protein
MVCDDGLHKSGEGMEHQDGVPATAGEGVTTDLTSKDDRPRCPHCKAWVSADGQCRNPRCSRNGEQVVEGDVQFSQRPEVRAAARHLGEEAEIVRVIVEGADPETLRDVVAQTEQAVRAATTEAQEVPQHPASAYACPDCGGSAVTVDAWETELVTRRLEDGVDVAAPTRHGDVHTDEVVALRCEGCDNEAARDQGDDLAAWGATEERGERGRRSHDPDSLWHPLSLDKPHCPACGSAAVDATAWETARVTRRLAGDGGGGVVEERSDAYAPIEDVDYLRCTDCGHKADAEQGDDIRAWREVTVRDLHREVGYGWRIDTSENWEPPANDPYTRWDDALRAGRDYMAGSDTPMDAFVKRYRSPMRRWQQMAYRWALQHPERMLVLRNDTNFWEVYKRGEYVEFGLPHHDAGGERHYISRNGKSKIRVNED